MNNKYFGKVDRMNDKASLVLAVNNNQYTAIVNGQTVLKAYGQVADILDGSIEYVAQSGTFSDFGIRCKFRNTELWVFDN